MTNSALFDEFQGTERFVLQRRIGAGGMGVVYRAYDRARDELVAIKTLRHIDATALYRLKREFRTMADFVHPNLVRLHELFSAQGQWFFAMEYVDGSTFLDYVREITPADIAGRWPPDVEDSAADDPCAKHGDWARESRSDLTWKGGTGDETPPTPGKMTRSPGRGIAGPALEADQLRRLRDALRQLAAGVHFLHQAGRLHRDLKPSNVLVSRQGRVIILDFGLVAEFASGEASATMDNLIVGTAHYMAPEQAAGKQLSTASDWYSVGVMAYEALTGRCPFVGSSLEALTDKQTFDPPSPKELIAGVPEDLDWLCAALLRRDPEARPSATEILRRLGRVEDQPQNTSRPWLSADPGEKPFFGRQAQLNMIHDALAAVRGGRTVVVYVRGESGVGKTTLVRRALKELRASEAAVVLTGRCYERESAPYKAFDSLADALSHYLVKLSTLEADALMPRETAALSQVFPVLQRVEAVAEKQRRASVTPDKQELRERAFRAFRELLTRLGDRKTLVLHIDDLQWGDLDSVVLLQELLRPPDLPNLLLIICYRSEDETTSPALRAMLNVGESSASALDVCQVDVDALSHDEARQLALALLPGDHPDMERLGNAIARESGGHPYFVDVLARHHGEAVAESGALWSSWESSPAAAIRLDEVLWRRARDLPEPAQRLLEAVAVAAHPVRLAVAARAAGLSGGHHEVVDLLRVAQWIRSSGTTEETTVETYHDRIREALVAHLSGEALARCHRHLAVALEASAKTDPATVASHYLGGGDAVKAAYWYVVAADEAADGLAFDRAAVLYGMALHLHSAPGDQTRLLHRKYADALANAGRGAEAGREYLAVAAEFEAADALELQRCAATQFLTSGHIEEGLSALRTVFATLGMGVPATPRRALLSFLAHRVFLQFRGLGFRERSPSAISSEDLARADACWSAAIGLSVVAPVRGADFLTRGLLRALRCGEPYRIARCFALAAIHFAMEGERAEHRTQRFLQQAGELVRRVGNPHGDALLRFADGAAACLTGRWHQATQLCDQADRLFREGCTGVAWELDTAHAFALWSLYWAGEIGELTRRFPQLLAEARKRGTLYVLANLNTFVCTVVALAADEPHRAEPALQEQMNLRTREGFHVQHMHGLYSRVLIDTYVGKGHDAWTAMKREYRLLRRSQLLRVQLVRMMIHEARARCAVAAAATAKSPTPLLRAAQHDARRLERERSRWGGPAALITRAGVAMVRGDPPQAMTLLRKAIAAFEAVDMSLHAATARRRLGQLLGGQEGRTLVEEADSWMMSQHIVNPERMTGLYVPGLSEQK